MLQEPEDRRLFSKRMMTRPADNSKVLRAYSHRFAELMAVSNALTKHGVNFELLDIENDQQGRRDVSFTIPSHEVLRLENALPTTIRETGITLHGGYWR